MAGDWHGNVGWVQAVLPALRRVNPAIKTLLHAGDWWMDTKVVDFWASKTGLERILVTLGNHEPYGEYQPLLDAHPGCAVRISEVTWLLPRPFAFEISGRRFVSLGGAASVDRLLRTEGKDWWPAERILDEHVRAAVKLQADVMVTHEPPANTPIRSAQELFASNPHNFPPETLAESTASRERVKTVWEALHPALLFHGHLHQSGVARTSDGRRVVSLNRDVWDGNIWQLDVTNLDATALPLRAIRG
jgi:Icc-related predicted phosphoesterase